MADTIDVNVRIDGTDAQYDIASLEKRLARAQSSLDRLNRSMGRLTRTQNNMNRVGVQTNRFLTSLERHAHSTNSALIGLEATSQAISNIWRVILGYQIGKNMFEMASSIEHTADKINLMRMKMKTLTQESGSFLIIRDRANQVGIELSTLANTVGRFSIATKGAFTTNEMADWAEALVLSGRAAGTTAKEMQSTLLQLSQAFSGDALQGEELRAIRENAPLYVEALRKVADQAGFTGKTLKELGAEGELTTEFMVKALDVLKNRVGEFKGLTETLETAQIRMGNQWDLLIEQVYRFEDSGSFFRDAVNNVADWLGELRESGDAIRYVETLFYDLSQTLALIDPLLSQIGKGYSLILQLMSGDEDTTIVSALNGMILNITTFFDLLVVEISYYVQEVANLFEDLNPLGVKRRSANLLDDVIDEGLLTIFKQGQYDSELEKLIKEDKLAVIRALEERKSEIYKVIKSTESPESLSEQDVVKTLGLVAKSAYDINPNSDISRDAVAGRRRQMEDSFNKAQAQAQAQLNTLIGLEQRLGILDSDLANTLSASGINDSVRDSVLMDVMDKYNEKAEESKKKREEFLKQLDGKINALQTEEDKLRELQKTQEQKKQELRSQGKTEEALAIDKQMYVGLLDKSSQYDQLFTKTKQWENELIRLQKPLKDILEPDFTKLEKEFHKQRNNIEKIKRDAIKAKIDESVVEENYQKQMAELNDLENKLKEERTKDFFKELKYQFDTGAKALEDYNFGLAKLDSLFKNGQISADVLNTSVFKLRRSLVDTLSKGDDEIAKFGLTSNQMLSRLLKLSDDFASSFQSSFADALKGNENAFDNFADNMKEKFLDMLAEMAYQALVNPIVVGVQSGMMGAFGLGGSQNNGIAGTGFSLSDLGDANTMYNMLGGNSLAGTMSSGVNAVSNYMGYGNIASVGISGAPTTTFGAVHGFGGQAISNTPSTLAFGGSNLGIGAAGLLGGFAADKIFGGEYSGTLGGAGSALGYSLGAGAAASAATGSTLASLGAATGPIGAIAGMIIGGALGSAFGGGGDDTPDMHIELSGGNTTRGMSKFQFDENDLNSIVSGRYGGIRISSQHDAFESEEQARQLMDQMAGMIQPFDDIIFKSLGDLVDNRIKTGMAGWYKYTKTEEGGLGNLPTEYVTDRYDRISDIIGGEYDWLYDRLRLYSAIDYRSRVPIASAYSAMYDQGDELGYDQDYLRKLGTRFIRGKNTVTEEGLGKYVEDMQAVILALDLMTKNTDFEEYFKTAVSFSKGVRTSAVEIYNLGLQLLTVNDTLPLVNQKLYDLNTAGANLANDLVLALGGLEQFTAGAQFFFENFYSEMEHNEHIFEETSKSIARFNKEFDTNITDKDSLRSLVEGLDLTKDAGIELYAASMRLAPTLNENARAFDAINSKKLEELNAVRDQEISLLITLKDKLIGFRDSIRDFIDSIQLSDLSPLSRFEKFIESQRQYERILDRAKSGDKESLADYTKYAQQYLTSGRDAYRSSDKYSDIYNKVLGDARSVDADLTRQIGDTERKIEVVVDNTEVIAALYNLSKIIYESDISNSTKVVVAINETTDAIKNTTYTPVSTL